MRVHVHDIRYKRTAEANIVKRTVFLIECFCANRAIVKYLFKRKTLGAPQRLHLLIDGWKAPNPIFPY